jgi:hypothetical protein
MTGHPLPSSATLDAASMEHTGDETAGTGKWKLPGVPHRGWHCVNVEDLGKPTQTCAMCERKEIRYVHYMAHADYHDILACGCFCAGRMAEDYDGARAREVMLRNAASRRRRWLSRQWRKSGKGNDFLNTADGYNVVVYPGGAAIWTYFVKNRTTEETFKPRRPFESNDSAKLAAFDTLIWMKNTGH